MAKNKFKESVVGVPGIGYSALLASNIAKLPQKQQAHEEALEKHAGALAQVKQAIATLTQQVSKLTDELHDKIASLEQAQDNLRKQVGSSKPAGHQKDELFADDHLMDKFYTDFEDRFRGEEAMIMERQEEYLPYFLKSELNFKNTPVLDIGSGRGEFIQLLKNNKVDAIGLDINLDMVERAKKKGLNSIQGDVLELLQSKKSQTYGAITGFHIVEHIPFNILLRVFSNAYRTLTKDGFVIFETPNPENLIVGSTTFYLDPSHLHPVPPALLAFTLEVCGFRDVQILRLHPNDEHGDLTGVSEEIANLMYGPRDYAVIGYK